MALRVGEIKDMMRAVKKPCILKFITVQQEKDVKMFDVIYVQPIIFIVDSLCIWKSWIFENKMITRSFDNKNGNEIRVSLNLKSNKSFGMIIR